MTRLPLWIAATLLFVGCPLSPPRLEPSGCEDDLECGEGVRCIDEQCVGEGEGEPPCLADSDGDGRGAGCPLGEDCNEGDPAVYAAVDGFPDDDGDGIFAGLSVVFCTDGTLPLGVSATAPAVPDCDDDDPTRAPGLLELCDAFDNNCSGASDEDSACPCAVFTDLDALSPHIACGQSRRWEDASACLALPGYHMAIVDNVSEQSFVQTLGNDFWIGLSDIDSEDDFVWVDGSAMSFEVFNNNEPNNQDNEDCVHLAGTGWNDNKCDNRFRFICEGNPALRDTTGVGCIDGDGDGRGDNCRLGPDCDDDDDTAWATRAGYADVDGDSATAAIPAVLCFGDVFPAGFELGPSATHDCDDRNANVQSGCPCEVRYLDTSSYLICNTVREWPDARDDCTSRSRNLVKIVDDAEADFLTEETRFLGGNSYWIGLNDRQTEGTFRWQNDNSALTYNNFAANEPNNQGTENCAEMQGGGLWNDSQCDNARRYICE